MTVLPKLHIEVCCIKEPIAELKEQVNEYLVSRYMSVQTNKYLHGWEELQDFQDIKSIRVCETNNDACQFVVLNQYELMTHVFVLIDETQPDNELFRQTILPSPLLQGQWEQYLGLIRLCFDLDIKNSLLNYINTGLLFSDHGVDPNIVSVNRVVLLDGPPGIVF